MKRFILLLILVFSIPAWSADYTCLISTYRLDFKTKDMESTLIVRDRPTGEYVMNALVDNMELSGDRLSFYFEDLKLTFRAQDINDQSEIMIGLIEGTFGRGYLNTSLRCRR